MKYVICFFFEIVHSKKRRSFHAPHIARASIPHWITRGKYNNLEVWEPEAGYDEKSIDGDLGEVGQSKMGGSGWNAEEMFRTNQQKFRLTSTYAPKLTGYTVELEKENTIEFKVAFNLMFYISLQRAFFVDLRPILLETNDNNTF